MCLGDGCGRQSPIEEGGTTSSRKHRIITRTPGGHVSPVLKLGNLPAQSVKKLILFVVASFCENQRSSDPTFESRWPCGHFASRNSRIGRGIAEISIGESLCYSAQSKVLLRFLRTPLTKKDEIFVHFVPTGVDPFPSFKTGLIYRYNVLMKSSHNEVIGQPLYGTCVTETMAASGAKFSPCQRHVRSEILD